MPNAFACLTDKREGTFSRSRSHFACKYLLMSPTNIFLFLVCLAVKELL